MNDLEARPILRVRSSTRRPRIGELAKGGGGYARRLRQQVGQAAGGHLVRRKVPDLGSRFKAGKRIQVVYPGFVFNPYINHRINEISTVR